MLTALYVARQSPIHRMRTGVKLLALPVLGTLLFATSSLPVLVAALLLVIALYAVARIPGRILLGQVRAVAVVLALFFLVQLWLTDWVVAAVTALRFLALILLASLVTLTTRSSDMIEALERGLARLTWLGIDPAKVSLAIALVLRFVPVIQAVFADVREAQAARGRERSLFALAVPVIVRTLKMADEIAEAIDARS